jgi:hypothetical protein
MARRDQRTDSDARGSGSDQAHPGAAAVHFYQTKEFEKAFQKAILRGGPGKRAWEKVRAILGGLGEDDPFAGVVNTTKHGESRIPHCVKYDLGNGWRLVTTHHEKACGFLFMGSHDDVEHWAQEHRGQQFAVQDGHAVLVPGPGPSIPSGRRVTPGDGSLVDLLPTELADHVLEGVPRSLARRLEELDASASSNDVQAIADDIEDSEKAGLILAVLNQLLAGNVDGAASIAELHMGAITAFDELDEERFPEVEDGPEVRRLPIGSPEYEKWLEAFEKRSVWHEWFLFLHPEQEKVVRADYPGVTQLSGVSGSGKTCVAVRRALRFAEGKDSRVLLVTLNRSLAGLLRLLVEAVEVDDEVRARVEVTSFFDLAQRLILGFEPENERIYQDQTWKLGEHVDEVFREYYRQWLNFHDAEVLLPLHRTMNARGVNGELYLREEFDWIRSAVGPLDRGSYLDMPRRGRLFPIGKEMRQAVLDGLGGWETKMREVGVVDYLGLTSALSHHIDSIEAEYTHVFIDEAQDLGTTELRIIRKLVPEGPNDLFLCGDVAQTILPKHRSLADAGITSLTRERIVQNYRNSREILNAAYDLLRHNLHEDMLDSEDLEILDPKFASFSGPAPMALHAETLEEEIAYARAFAESRLSQGARTVCIGFAGFSARDIAAFAEKCGVTALHGDYDPASDKLVFSDLEQTKGYEFETLIIVQCTAGVLPPRDEPEEEAHRAACKLYVAMTRARRELILSFHGEASPWITAVNDSISTDLWSDVEVLRRELLNGVPELLPEVPEASPDAGVDVALELPGAEFLYTRYALGLSLDAQERLDELVEAQDGAGEESKGGPQWTDVGSLITALSRSGDHDGAVGPAVADELRELGRRLRAG